MDMRRLKNDKNDDNEDIAEKKDAGEGADVLAARFLKTRQILLTGEIDKSLSEKIIRQLLILEASGSSSHNSSAALKFAG